MLMYTSTFTELNTKYFLSTFPVDKLTTKLLYSVDYLYIFNEHVYLLIFVYI